MSEDGNNIHLFPTEGTSNSPWLYAHIDPMAINGSSISFEWIVTEQEIDSEYHYVGDNDNCTYVRTNYKAKNFRLVCINLNNPSRVNFNFVANVFIRLIDCFHHNNKLYRIIGVI